MVGHTNLGPEDRPAGGLVHATRVRARPAPAEDVKLDVLRVHYDPAHRFAEADVFDSTTFGEDRPGMGTRCGWGKLPRSRAGQGP